MIIRYESMGYELNVKFALNLKGK